ncbi:MAG TPA: lipoprotein insertase outer membrane protein LolB [Candidatus Saccharimonadia bacterium]|nr:lipoprotein insertase outer membrane protein LolB [Candidatus Saccharimonadia bacterium]
MTRAGCATRVAIALSCVVLAGCASAPRRAMTGSELAARAAALAEHARWSLDGRVAVSDGKDGGSGRIEWRQDGADYVIEIRAPVSRQTWRLASVGGALTLEGARREPVHGDDAEALLAREVGWRLPIEQMAHWARGVAASPRAEVELDDAGLPRTIREAGWLVEFRRFDAQHEPPLPVRIAASRPPYTVRLAVAQWRNE